jgi:glycosyltransferase involved in cell wall biosynthesis
VLFVCSWAADEPYMEVIEAARLLGPDVDILITGNSRGREHKIGRGLPSNVVLTGFLDDSAYDELLQDSDLVIDLTAREDCLVCGAYEAMAASRPLLLSDTRALRQYFDRGTLFTSNHADDIARQTRTALTQLPEMAREMQLLKESRSAEWEEDRLELEKLLEGLAESKSHARVRSTQRIPRANPSDADHPIAPG